MDSLNTTYWEAWALVKRVLDWSLPNLWYNRFKHFKVEGIVLVPVEKGKGKAPFEEWMFKEGQFLEQRSLNFHIRILYPGQDFLINAGYLRNKLIIGEFYQELAIIRKGVKGFDFSSIDTTTKKDSSLPPQGLSNPE